MAKKKFIQKAVAKMKRKGTIGSYGHHSEKTMKRDIKKGGKRGKKAQFALNMKRIASKRKSKRKARKSRRSKRTR